MMSDDERDHERAKSRTIAARDELAAARADVATANDRVAWAVFREAARDCVAAPEIVVWMWYLGQPRR
jgi:hypothetical protein